MLWRKRCKVYISIYNIELPVNGRNVEEAREIWAAQFDGRGLHNCRVRLNILYGRGRKHFTDWRTSPTSPTNWLIGFGFGRTLLCPSDLAWRKRCKVYISIYNIELQVNGCNVEEAREIFD